MSEQIHDDEPDTSETTVRRLLAAERPEWAQLPTEYIRSSGTDNAMWRLHVDDGNDLVVRLPRRPNAAANVSQETQLLIELSEIELPASVTTPAVRHVGSPHESFPHRWSVLDWLDGADAWTARDTVTDDDLNRLAADLGEAVVAIGNLQGLTAGERARGKRGGPIADVVKVIDRWLTDPQWDASSRVDVDSVRRLAERAAELSTEAVRPGFSHGDLIPGNLLLRGSHLTGIIDWGGAGYGDRAQDLSPAWSVFDSRSRSIFLDAVGADDATIIRARTFELEHAVGGVLYYEPKNHPLGDVMRRTLNRILSD